MQAHTLPPVRSRRFASRGALDAALAAHLRRAALVGEEHAIMLSGGATPGPAFNLLGAERLPVAQGLRVLYSDERHVPSESAASNYHLSAPLLAALRLPTAQVLRVRTELPLAAAADDYDVRLQHLLDEHIHIGLGLLGLGADGHTASLFSHADLQRSGERLAIAVNRPDSLSAVSVTPHLLAHVEHLLFVVAGADKKAALAALLARDASIIATRAIENCSDVEVWADPQALPP